MRKLKVASVALLVVASTGLVFGSMGFSSVAADRGVSVSVVNDSSALVGYDTKSQTITPNERVELVTVKNQLSSDANITNLEVDIEETNGTVRVDNISQPTTIPAGEERTIDAAIDCSAETAELTVSVTVEADGVTAEISGDTATRTFEVDCADLKAHGGDVRFPGKGNGNVHFDGWSDGSLNVTYWTESGGGFAEHELVNVDASKNLKNAIRGGQTNFVAVYVEESGKTYFNPKFLEDGDDRVVDGKQAPN